MNRLKAVMFKRAFLVPTALLIAACLLTACQPTPEEPIVAQKQETYQERETPSGEAGAATDSLIRADLNIPEHISESYELGDILSLNIDADVKTAGDLMLYKVYNGALKDFTQQQANHFADMFVNGKNLTAYDDRNTKDEITEYFLLPAQKTLSELESGTYVKDNNLDGDAPIVESVKEQIKMYEQWIADAPEQRSNDTITIDSFEANSSYFYGEFPIEGSKITGKFMVGTGLRNECGGLGYYNSGYDLMEPHNLRPEPVSMALPEGGLGLNTTPEQAVEQATQVKNDLGADELEFYAVMQAEAWVEEMGIGGIDAYYVLFTRRFDDIPVLYTRESMAGNAYGPGQANEKLVVTVDDTGVIAVNWLGNTEITGVLNENPKFIDFDKVLDAAKNQVDATYSFSPDGGELREHQAVTINSVSLEYLRMKEPNGGEGDVRFVPAWVFDGEYKIVYSDEALQQNKIITQKEEIYPLGKPIVVNALDGSAFDPMFVDGIEPPKDAKPFAPKS